ncbi:hypothetical protein [Thalassovita sp.]|uniref:hypothetical protein n=1 Tax=Thalassovita sp. TaxID=1979401 RepID=UPI002B26AD1B|nr:hypothetical protein [Thalassovita sp.]
MQPILKMAVKGPAGRSGDPNPIPLNARQIAVYVGLVAFSLPIILYTAAWLAPYCRPSSISHSYYIPFWGSYFVGALGFIAVFLFCYPGHTKWDNRLASLGAVGAMLTVIFPTGGDGCAENYFTGRSLIRYFEDTSLTPPGRGQDILYHYDLADLFGYTITSQTLHFTGAALVFSVLAYFALWAFRRDNGEGVRKTAKGDVELSMRKIQRNTIYLICGLTILACMAAIAFWPVKTNDGTTALFPPIFTLESIALFAFGISWVVKGRLLKILRETG